MIMKQSVPTINRLVSLGIAAILIFLPIGSGLFAQDSISLAGQWKLKLDKNDIGLQEQWYNERFSDSQSIVLPGSIQEYDLGEKISTETKWVATRYEQFFELDKYAPYRTDDNFKFPYWLTSDTHYQGVTWFQKEVTIPENWNNKQITLELERPHWGSMVFVNGQNMGADSSLAIPHRYDLSEVLSPGTHTLSIRVDNRILYDIGLNSHSITEHTQSNWNGLVGDLLLKASDPVFISEVQVYPDVENKQARVKVHINNITGSPQSGNLQLRARSVNAEEEQVLPPAQQSFTVSESGVVELTYSMGDDPLLWDEFNPQFYALDVNLESGSSYTDTYSTDFGMRDFTVEGARFHINGRPIFLRGTLESAIFPETGYPAMSKKEWAHHFEVAKQHGLNHIRFHSWCPPKAAFEAADELGIYLQVEASVWVNQGATLGDGKPVDQFVIDESKRVMKEYGNHPSFVMFAHGNEPGGDNYEAYLADFVSMWKQKDNRRVYTSGSGWPAIDENEFHDLPDPRIQQWGEELNSVINGTPPSTDWNFEEDIAEYDIPVIGHEIGQWTVYPNFNEMSKYTGVLYPHNFEIFRDFLEENHMLHQAHDFLMASGKLQALCYKADIEAALRTPGYAGYQMLDLHDFPGQGTALVGILDPFWDDKPYINSEEFSRFSSQTVPLAVMEKRILSNTETFRAELEIAHFAEHEADDIPVRWKITNNQNRILASSETVRDLPIGNNIKAGTASLDLSSFNEAQKLNLSVSAGHLGENDWDFWVFPENVDTESSSDIIVTKTLTPAIERKLQDGAKVLLQVNGKLKEGKGKEVVGGFSTVFWNTAWTLGQAPHTMGVLVEPTDPLFKNFPTEYHTNWQWWDIVHDVHPMVLNDFPADLTPKIQMIDTWFEARKLGLLFEATIGKGKLVVTSIDFEDDLDQRPAARQLYHSLLEYMESSDFDPDTPVNLSLIEELYE
ncbi:sugar-binding domain-containing protein [Aliifodinibius sp. S!AR15-10]|uniref:sugar-binding domain-containing protein n=1 Tax=Aliifodinibius sp. S!AR15-10 TaxID=2950437 RepID=UPI002870843F|nr:sugar-binding domain-containing protein [Aliifodinibius sp. S!AR15-10]